MVFFSFYKVNSYVCFSTSETNTMGQASEEWCTKSLTSRTLDRRKKDDSDFSGRATEFVEGSMFHMELS